MKKFKEFHEAVMSGPPDGAMSDAPYVDATMNDPESPKAIYLCQKNDTGERKRFDSEMERDNFLSKNKEWNAINESTEKITKKNINSAQKITDESIQNLEDALSDYIRYPDQMSVRFEDKDGRTDMKKFGKERDSYIKFFNDLNKDLDKYTDMAKKGI
jgi:hypothetical protein